jgi:hypothetical protein
MGKGTQILVALVVAAASIYLAGLMMSFFGIGLDVYGPYLLFGVALIIFYAMLPGEVPNIFK